MTEGGTQIFIYTLNRNHLFASTASAIEKLGLNIMDARIFTSAKNYCMNTFTVLESDGTPVSGSIVRRKEIIGLIREYLLDPSQHLKASTKRIDRKLKHFSRHVETEVINSDDNPYTTLEINCPDQPGILASIGKIFADHSIQLQNARIATLGERVEDLFFILDTDNRKITDAEDIEKLQNDIRQELGD